MREGKGFGGCPANIESSGKERDQSAIVEMPGMIPVSLGGARATATRGHRGLFTLHGAGHVRPIAIAPPRSGLLRQYEGVRAVNRGLELLASARSTQ